MLYEHHKKKTYVCIIRISCFVACLAWNTISTDCDYKWNECYFKPRFCTCKVILGQGQSGYDCDHLMADDAPCFVATWSWNDPTATIYNCLLLHQHRHIKYECFLISTLLLRWEWSMYIVKQETRQERESMDGEREIAAIPVSVYTCP